MLRFSYFLLLVTLVSIHKTSAAKIGPRIFNGEKASPGQFPWDVALYITKDDGRYFCGGSIISQEWILTAGHCVSNALSVEIHSGTISVSGGLVSKGATMTIHEEYDASSLNNDIALIRLSETLLFGDETKSIDLASDSPDDGVEVVVSGWGATSKANTSTADTLVFAYLDTISSSDCEKVYGSGHIHEGMLCASPGKTTNSGPCNGDSGDPLVDKLNTAPTLVGIFSFSRGDCEAGEPFGFTRVAYYRDWILEKTGL